MRAPSRLRYQPFSAVARKIGTLRHARSFVRAGCGQVRPEDYFFDLQTFKKPPLHHHHEASAGFKDVGRRPTPRVAGGCCTTFNVFEGNAEEGVVGREGMGELGLHARP